MCRLAHWVAYLIVSFIDLSVWLHYRLFGVCRLCMITDAHCTNPVWFCFWEVCVSLGVCQLHLLWPLILCYFCYFLFIILHINIMSSELRSTILVETQHSSWNMRGTLLLWSCVCIFHFLQAWTAEKERTSGTKVHCSSKLGRGRCTWRHRISQSYF